ncbi:MAG: hypothetical protein ABIK28_10495 [Planctomycetota bacterium]
MASSNIKITNVQYTTASIEEVKHGLNGWVSCTLNGQIQLDGITVRRTRCGKTALSFPAKMDSFGNKHYYLRPLDETARRIIESQIFSALKCMGKSA